MFNVIQHSTFNIQHLTLPGVQLIDLLIIAAYLVAVVAAGAWFGKRQSSTTQYFLAGQNVPWWAISASIVATETSTKR